MKTAPARSDWSKYMQKYNRNRRARLLAEGICVDCGVRPASKRPGRIIRGEEQKRVCCDECLDARKLRQSTERVPPLAKYARKTGAAWL
jgi:hypothetical protein